MYEDLEDISDRQLGDPTFGRRVMTGAARARMRAASMAAMAKGRLRHPKVTRKVTLVHLRCLDGIEP